MAKVSKINKRVQLSLSEIVHYQLLTHCYLEKIKVSDADLDCLTALALSVDQDLNTFCKNITEIGIFKSEQTVRNALSKMQVKNLVIKSGKSKKRVSLNPNIIVQTTGNILLNYSILSLNEDAA